MSSRPAFPVARVALLLLALAPTLLVPARADAQSAASPPALAADAARIHYHRPKGDYSGWGLHAWEDARVPTEWSAPMPASGRDAFGVYWDVPLKPGAKKLGLIIHSGDRKDPGPDQFADLTKGREWWVASGRNELASASPDVASLAFGDLSRQKAQWLDRNTLVWNAGDGDAWLHASPAASLKITKDGVTGGSSWTLRRVTGGLTQPLLGSFPHLAAATVWRLEGVSDSQAAEILRGQVALSWRGRNGDRDATGVQLHGVLDDLFATDAPLGVTWQGTAPRFSVWAPTAQKVRLLVFDSPRAQKPSATLDMALASGVFAVDGKAEWKGRYYLYEVTVFHPTTGRIETITASDPYSRGLSRNGERSWIVDLDDPALAPPGWSTTRKPALEAPEDATVYELHVRDFSASDESVPVAHRGTFLAFTDSSAGTSHLRSLANAGLTHVHLLPVFDFATVDEDRSTWQSPGDLSSFPPDGEQQQAAVSKVRERDGFNWGYDPLHYGVPEGSYATDADGAARIVEFRRMVQGLSALNLRVVMDVVYNHTHASGLDAQSVLDRIVPGYYQRLNADGAVENSTCCANTASEHAMMERVMRDDVLHWVRDYKVDGFRFDLMGHHMKRNMERLRRELDALPSYAAGADGRSVLLYGEGWNFGEVQNNQRGVNATQQNLAGTGIGTFNDRSRDAVRGGNPFADRREQGFATGLWSLPSAFQSGGDAAREKLRDLEDKIRIGLAGNLAGWSFTDHRGRPTTGGGYSGTGYAADPQECVNYVEAHDNETLWDKIQYAAAAGATLEQRVRMQTLALSVPALSQGIPFFHAGGEILRSKSMEADSYDYGDWFNRVDWTHATNHWGMGLPSADKNRDRWPIIKPLLVRADLAPDRATIEAAFARFLEVLRVRRSSPLFRLRDAADIQARIGFLFGGPGGFPGVIAMTLSDAVEGRPDLDARWERVLVVFNANPNRVNLTHPGFAQIAWELHPAQREGADPVVKTVEINRAKAEISVPAFTTTVFVAP